MVVVWGAPIVVQSTVKDYVTVDVMAVRVHVSITAHTCVLMYAGWHVVKHALMNVLTAVVQSVCLVAAVRLIVYHVTTVVSSAVMLSVIQLVLASVLITVVVLVLITALVAMMLVQIILGVADVVTNVSGDVQISAQSDVLRTRNVLHAQGIVSEHVMEFLYHRMCQLK